MGLDLRFCFKGSVWTCDVNWDSTRLATGGADFTVRLWDVETGTTINTIDDNAGLQATAKSVSFSYCGNLIGMSLISVPEIIVSIFPLVFPSGAEMKRTPTLQIFDVRMNPSDGAIRKRELPKSEYNDGVPIKSLWGFNDEMILTGNDNGSLYVWDMNNLDELHRNESQHSKQINDMQVHIEHAFLNIFQKNFSIKISQ